MADFDFVYKKGSMNIRMAINCGLLLICIFMPEIGRAQAGWTVDECMRYAIEHNFALRNYQLDSKIAQAEMRAAYGEFLPVVSTTGNLGQRLGRSVDPSTNQYTSDSFAESTIGLNVSLPLFEGFTRINKLQYSKLNRKISVYTEKVEENNLAFEVLEAFYRCCLDRKVYELAVEQRKLSELYYGQALEFMNLGIRSKSDLQEVKARLQSDIYQETVKSNNCALSLLALKEIMGMKAVDTLLVCIPNEEDNRSPVSINLNELYAISELSLPEFHIMKMREKASQELLSVSFGTLSPSVRMDFNLNSGYYNSEKNEYGEIVPFRDQINNNMNKYIGLSISLPILTGLSRFKEIRTGKLRLQQVQNENEQRRLSLYKEISDAYFSLLAASRERQLAKEQLHLAFITWKESEEKWNEGLITVFELLEKRNLYIQAKVEIVRTKLQYDLKERLIRFYQVGSFV